MTNDQRGDIEPTQTAIFSSGEAGYFRFRIPSLVRTEAGTLLAICEGRRSGRTDFGDIDLLVKRSFDGGQNWGTLQVIATSGREKVGNPTAVVDRSTGTIWVLVLHQCGNADEQQQFGRDGVGRIEICTINSTDDGVTWSKPVDITSQVLDPQGSFGIVGPGLGIQLKSGRLLIPSYFKTDWGKATFSNATWSDDHGQTWQHGEVCAEGGNECQAIELNDGRVMLNMRNLRRDLQRLVAYSEDGGATWSEAQLEPQLIEPICQASLIRCDEGLLFSNPASHGRDHMTVRLSRDEGQTWTQSGLLWEGPAGYSCLANLGDGEVGCLYERGTTDYCDTITFARFNLDWLTAEGAGQSANK